VGALHYYMYGINICAVSDN